MDRPRDRWGGAARSRRPTWALAFGVALLVLVPAGAAGADPARPTDYRSQVLAVDPPLPAGASLRVVGGDAFLELRVPRGHLVVVPDYPGGDGASTRPYLRFRPDGIVQRNERSAAAVANERRYGSSGRVPAPGAIPRWRTVARDGRYVWHDHRIHWMLPTRPRAVDPDGRVDLGGAGGTWTIELEVDGHPATVTGELLLLDPPRPVPWFLGIALLATLLPVITWRRVRAGRSPAHRAIALVLCGAGIVATAVALVEWRSIPPGAGGSLLAVALPAVGAFAAAAAAATSPRTQLAALAAAVGALGTWAVLRRDVLDHAVLPTSLPAGLDRAGTALALGLAIGAGVVLVWRPPVPRPGPPG